MRYRGTRVHLRGDMDIVRDGELEATNYFFSMGDQENVLELTLNHDGRSYELGTGYGHSAVGGAGTTRIARPRAILRTYVPEARGEGGTA